MNTIKKAFEDVSSEQEASSHFSDALKARLSLFSLTRKLFRRYTNRGKQREEHINCRVTRAERLHIERIADLYGVTTSHLIRDLIFTCGGVTNFTVLADLLETLVSCYPLLPGPVQQIIIERGQLLSWNGQNLWNEPALNSSPDPSDEDPPPSHEDPPRNEGAAGADDPPSLRAIRHMLDQLRQVRISELRLEADIWDELTPQEQGLLRRALDLRYRSDNPPVSWDGGSSESDPSHRGPSADAPTSDSSTSDSPTADSSGADSHGTDSHGTDSRAESHAAPQATEHRSTCG